MKVLVTGFDPFGGEKVNPAFEVIKRLSSNIAGAEIVKLQVPTVFRKSIDVTIKAIEEEKPDFVLCIGQAGGRFAITVERVAINIDDARIPDNENNQPIDTPIDPEGEPAYFATIPIKAIVEAVKNEGIPAAVSNTAGTYVCNHLLYGVLNYINKNDLNIKAGFIHIPFLPEQVVDKPNMPSMSIETMVKAIEIAITTIVASK
ncbi:pyroglutamyl-peptidase I . Cysteine peptidase. MEROPS family C15 [Caldanaerobius fijiensis DSM 17918]|uniref:Pyrrolidone-carboxylate peptidase n=1 Tax=Caldanaerobius fijiensis DSM 17918 TaxID=1121256 RepID=A0A1M5ATX2_9THEO|nr:pyroglutamyl-peptidase I [Caldanaerobius fijiensis]SHF33655.1 pyroglutamyl-peptidase I . Cysteine peptidase. MEROPS family C15 [Caldanaerobius fijiensis DSM 17918]